MKFLIFQRTFYKKSFGPGLGLMPQHSTHTKSTAMPCFLFFRICWNCRSKPCFKELLKKLLKNPQNFRTDYTTLFWRKLLKFQETFLEKFLASGFGAEAPTFNAQTKKHGNAVLFYIFRFYLSIHAAHACACGSSCGCCVSLGVFLICNNGFRCENCGSNACGVLKCGT